MMGWLGWQADLNWYACTWFDYQSKLDVGCWWSLNTQYSTPTPSTYLYVLDIHSRAEQSIDREEEMRRNLKICIPLTLLLFFLLPYISESAGGASADDYITQLLKKLKPWEKYTKGTNDILEKVVDQLKKEGKLPLRPPPPPPLDNPSLNPSTPTNCTNKSLQRLHLLKEYLSDYGYMEDSDAFTDCVDSELLSSLRSYQRFFNLPVSGDLDRATVRQLQLRRCAVPDVNVTYHLSSSSPPGASSWPNGTDWFAGRRSLAYAFHPNNTIPARSRKVFTDSFRRWSEAVKEVKLSEAEGFDGADIRIGFYDFEGRVGSEVVGGSIVKYVKGESFGYVVLDAGLLPSPDGGGEEEEEGVDLGSVVMHQIGHLLGLSHSSEADSVMYPYLGGGSGTRVKLSDGDVQQIRGLYSSSDEERSAGGGGGGGAASTTRPPRPSGDATSGIVIGSTSFLLTAFSLGFAAMDLFYH